MDDPVDLAWTGRAADLGLNWRTTDEDVDRPLPPYAECSPTVRAG